MSSEDRMAAPEAKVQELMDRQAIYECIKRNSRGYASYAESLKAALPYDPSGMLAMIYGKDAMARIRAGKPAEG
jgi:hypothetical protein